MKATLQKLEQGIKVVSHIQYKSKFDYFIQIIDIVSAVTIKREDWLTDQEKRFLACIVLHYQDGVKYPYDKTAMQIYKKYFSQKNSKREIANYIYKLRKKNWIEYENKILRIPETFFNEDNLLDLSISYKYDTGNSGGSDELSQMGRD